MPAVSSARLVPRSRFEVPACSSAPCRPRRVRLSLVTPAPTPPQPPISSTLSPERSLTMRAVQGGRCRAGCAGRAVQGGRKGDRRRAVPSSCGAVVVLQRPHPARDPAKRRSPPLEPRAHRRVTGSSLWLLAAETLAPTSERGSATRTLHVGLGRVEHPDDPAWHRQAITVDGALGKSHRNKATRTAPGGTRRSGARLLSAPSRRRLGDADRRQCALGAESSSTICGNGWQRCLDV